MRKGFLLDLNRCTGCGACRLACAVENGTEAGESWRRVFTFNEHRHPAAPVFHISLACNHCERPACLETCPARAYRRDAATGAVILDPGLCIGCRYCSWTCVFDAPRYNARRGTMSKCTMCFHRLAEEKAPACVSLCPTGALQWTDLGAAGAVEQVPGFSAGRLGPSIRFVPLRKEPPQPECSAAAAVGGDLALPAEGGRSSALHLGSEWPLVLFTFLAESLVALATAAQIAPISVPPVAFGAAGAVAAALSLLHLGKKRRAWRALLNLRRSWLSREAGLYLLFLLLSTAAFITGRALPGWIAAAAGFGTLFAIDRLYGAAAEAGSPRLHSGGAVLSGLFLAGIFAVRPLVFLTAGLGKLLLYARRTGAPGRNRRIAPAVVRIGAGLVFPAVVLPAWSPLPGMEAAAGLLYGWAVAGALTGELIDRIEYYLDLAIGSPERRVAADLRVFLSRRYSGPAAPPVRAYFRGGADENGMTSHAT